MLLPRLNHIGSKMDKILVIDQGTTSTRGIVFNIDGSIHTTHQIEHQQFFPKLGWVEHDPEEIWSAVKNCCAALLKSSDQKIMGIGITNQRETTVVWERESGKCLGNAIVWQDRRTTDFCEVLKQQNLESLVYQKTGLLLDPYFSASKIQWILNQNPGSFERAKKGELLFGTIDSFLLWRLTKGESHATDITNAARTLLFNIHTLSWDDELLEIFSIPKAMLPVVKDNCDDFGITSKDVLGHELPVLAMVGDQQGALIGQGCLQAGEAKCTFGTGSFLMINTGHKIIPSHHKLLNTIAYKFDSTINYAIEGSSFAAGSIIKWFRDQMHLIKTANESEILACQLSDNGGVYFVPAFTGLGAPYWDPNVRGSIIGITRDTHASHVVRAGLEAMAYQTKDLLNDEKVSLKSLKVDGGVTANNWLMQFLADILQLPILVSDVKEATALGAAYLVGLSTRKIKRLEDILLFLKPPQTFYPEMDAEKAGELYGGWKEAVRKTCA